MTRVAIQGRAGSFSECAAYQLVDSPEIVPCEEPEDLFRQLLGSQVEFAVVPIENARSGSMFDYYDLLLNGSFEYDMPCRIVKECVLNIHHNLVVNSGVRLQDVETVQSHPNALAQCHDYLKLNGLKREFRDDTAAALEGLPRNRAAIASLQAAYDQNMAVIDRSIQDRKTKNYTRFVLVSKAGTAQIRESDLRRADFTVKASVAFCIRNTPGSLFRMLSSFGSRDVDLVRIETRPLISTNSVWRKIYPDPEKTWDLIYYADLRARANSCRLALDQVKELALTSSTGLKLCCELGMYLESEPDGDATARLWRRS